MRGIARSARPGEAKGEDGEEDRGNAPPEPVRVALTALGSQTPKQKKGPQAPKKEKEVRPKGRSVSGGAAAYFGAT